MVMNAQFLTCTLMIQDNDLKIEFKNKYYIKNISFYSYECTISRL